MYTDMHFVIVFQSYEAALELDATLSHAHVNLGAIFHSRVSFCGKTH